MVNTAPTALSVPLVLVGALLSARALVATSHRTVALLLCSAFAIAFSAMMLYDQAVLAMPAFVGPLALVEVIRRRVSWMRAGVVLGVACAVVVAWYVEITLTGVIAARSLRLNGMAAAGVQVSDLVVAIERLWLGFVMHNVYLAAIVARGVDVGGWWTLTLGSVAALLAALGVLAAAAIMLLRAPERDGPKVPVFRHFGWSLVVAALLAAYAGVLPIGLAYPGFPLVSRMFYPPACFFSMAIAVTMALGFQRFRPPVVAAIVLYLGWSIVAMRRYLGEMRDGSMIARAVAREVARIAPTNPGGILVLGSDVYGTFSTPLIQFWSLRGAVEMLTGVKPPALFFKVACPGTGQRAPDPYLDESGHEVLGSRWSAVVAMHGDRAVSGASVDTVCARR